VNALIQSFEERAQEIDAYLDLLAALEQQVREGPPKLGGSIITSQQQKILYSSVYLQLYNLVEATATWCIDAVANAAWKSGRWLPADLSEELRREWVRVTARTHVPLNEENRLEAALKFFDRLVEPKPLSEWSLEKGGGGNWDDLELEAISVRLGFQLSISQPAYNGIKRKIREDRGTLALVKYFRNRLAHGSLSFAECGDGVTVGELRDIKERATNYLREVVLIFLAFIEEYRFIIPNRRPNSPT
jgi:hypothetical protein